MFAKALCGFTTVAVTFIAILLGGVMTGWFASIGALRYLEEAMPETKGLFVFMHEGIDWGFHHSAIPDLTGQVFVVTGANQGLGYWTAHILAANGGHVVMACRSAKRCDEAKSKIIANIPSASLEPSLLDLGSFASVRAFVDKMKSKDRIDSLVLNAGVLANKFALTADGLEMQMGVNHFGHFLLTTELQGVLVTTAKAKRQPTTIVVVSSSSHFSSYKEGVRLTKEEINDESKWEIHSSYGMSKLSNVLFGQELATRLKNHDVLVNIAHPGGVYTAISDELLDLIAPYSTLVVTGARAVMKQILWHPRDAALTQVFAAVGDEIISGKVTGQYYHPIARATVPHAHARNDTMQKALWALSEEVVRDFSS